MIPKTAISSSATADQIPAAPDILGDRILNRGETAQAYTVRMTVNQSELQAAQQLRFRVFNLELKEGLASSYLTGRDADEFDDVCDHLVVEEIKTGEIVGTYRLQTGTAAAGHKGYYSAQEFDLAPYEKLRPEIIELGRACVDIRHRNLVVLGLLWRGIAEYARKNRARYLMGCSSITSQDPALGATVYSSLQRRFLVNAELQTSPLNGLSCPLDSLLEATPKLPKLLMAYLSIGAKICGPPAIDRQFKTIDFLTWLDLDALPDGISRRYR